MQKNIFIKKILFYSVILLLKLGTFATYMPLTSMSVDEKTIQEILLKNQKLKQKKKELKATLQAYVTLSQNISQNEIPVPDQNVFHNTSTECKTEFFQKITYAKTTEELLDTIAMRIKELLQQAPKPMQSLKGKQKNQKSQLQLYIAISYTLCLCLEKLLLHPTTLPKTTIQNRQDGSYLIELTLYAEKEIFIFQFLINTQDHAVNTQQKIISQPHTQLTTYIWTFNITINKNMPQKNKPSLVIVCTTNKKDPAPFYVPTPQSSYVNFSGSNINENITILQDKIYNTKEMTLLLQNLLETTILSTQNYHNKNFKYSELYFHILIFYAYGLLPTYSVEAEVRAGYGLLDLLVNRGNNPIIIEIKYNKDAKAALNQIHQKQYYKISSLQKNNTLLIGMNITANPIIISSESERKDVTTSPFRQSLPYNSKNHH